MYPENRPRIPPRFFFSDSIGTFSKLLFFESEENSKKKPQAIFYTLFSRFKKVPLKLRASSDSFRDWISLDTFSYVLTLDLMELLCCYLEEHLLQCCHSKSKAGHSGFPNFWVLIQVRSCSWRMFVWICIRDFLGKYFLRTSFFLGIIRRTPAYAILLGIIRKYLKKFLQVFLQRLLQNFLQRLF